MIDILKILAEDKTLISYRPRLRDVCGSITGTILFQQILYWHNKNGGKPFYKFRVPCEHEKYRPGDSWTEELNFSPRELDSALENIGEKIRQKDLQAALDNSQKLVLYWTDISRCTWYLINPSIARIAMEALYVIDKNTNTKDAKEQTRNSQNSNYVSADLLNSSYIQRLHTEITTSSAQSAFEKTEKKKPGRKKKEAAEQLFESDPFESTEGEKDVRRKSLYQDFCAAYDQFHEEQSGMRLNFKNGATQKGIAGIWEALKAGAKNQDREQGALDSFAFIVQKWNTLDAFLKSQIQPAQMLAKLPNITQAIKEAAKRNHPGVSIETILTRKYVGSMTASDMQEALQKKDQPAPQRPMDEVDALIAKRMKMNGNTNKY